MPENLFDHLQDITLQSTSGLVLFLDYDGTLIPFQKKPDDVKTPKHVQTLLDELADYPSITVILITGRTLDNIKSLIDTRKIIIAALHGFEIQFPGQKEYVWEQARENEAIIQQIKKRSLQGFHQRKDVLIEDKTFTVAFHYRQVPKDESSDLIERFMKIYEENDVKKKLEVLHGDKVLEVRPRGWNKGKAVEMILKKLNMTNHCFSTVYIGDDTTDEDAFRFLKNNGITIYVKNESNRETAAHYSVENPEEVYRFLQWIKANF